MKQTTQKTAIQTKPKILHTIYHYTTNANYCICKITKKNVKDKHLKMKCNKKRIKPNLLNEIKEVKHRQIKLVGKIIKRK